MSTHSILIHPFARGLLWMPFTAKKTTALIIEGGNNYVITVKGNQPRLLAQLKTLASHQKPCERLIDIEQIRGLVRPAES